MEKDGRLFPADKPNSSVQRTTTTTEKEKEKELPHVLRYIAVHYYGSGCNDELYSPL